MTTSTSSTTSPTGTSGPGTGTSTTGETRTADAHPRPSTARPRGWAAAGLLAGLAGAAGIQASLSITPGWEESAAGDAEAIQVAMADLVPNLLAFHLTTMLAVVLLPVVAAGLYRRLRGAVPADSLLPAVAASGLLLAAVAGLMGTALNTEFIFGLSQPEQVVPESVAFFTHWVATVAWLWVGAGISGVALAGAWLRHRAVPRWIGLVSLVLGGATLLLGVSPLQYMAGFLGPVWLVVVSLGFLLGDRVPGRAADRLTGVRREH